LKFTCRTTTGAFKCMRYSCLAGFRRMKVSHSMGRDGGCHINTAAAGCPGPRPRWNHRVLSKRYSLHRMCGCTNGNVLKERKTTVNRIATGFLAAVLCLCTAGIVWAGETTCTCTADVSIDEWYPDDNLNYRDRIILSTNMNVHHGIARGLFLFAVPEDIEAEDITRAEIYFSASSHCGGGMGGSVLLCALNEPFDEETDTWNTLGGGDGDPSVTATGVLPAQNTWNQAVYGAPPPDAEGIDITGLLRENLKKVRANGILIRFADEHQQPCTHQNIASRESTDLLDFAPYIRISDEPLPCPAEVVFQQNRTALALLRTFRDRVLAQTSGGRNVIAAYYRNANAASRLLIADGRLRAEARAVAGLLLPAVRRVCAIGGAPSAADKK